MRRLSKTLRKQLCQGSAEEKLQRLLADLRSDKEKVYWRMCSSRPTSDQMFCTVKRFVLWPLYWVLFCRFAVPAVFDIDISIPIEWVWLSGVVFPLVFETVSTPGYCCLNRTERVLYLYNSFGRLRGRLTTHPQYACMLEYDVAAPYGPTYPVHDWGFCLIWYAHSLAERETYANTVLYCSTEIPPRRLYNRRQRWEMRPQEQCINRLFEEIADELSRQGYVKRL